MAILHTDNIITDPPTMPFMEGTYALQVDSYKHCSFFSPTDKTDPPTTPSMELTSMDNCKYTYI